MRDTGLGVKCQCYGLGLGYKVRIKDTYRIRNAWVRKGWGYEMSESDDSRNVLCFTAAIQTVISETVQSRTVRSIGGVARKTNFTHSSLIFTGGGGGKVRNLASNRVCIPNVVTFSICTVKTPRNVV